MQVLTSRREAFSYRVLDDYQNSEGYLKISKRQRFCSVEVLKFLLSHGVDEVRRREIRGKFIGDREHWERPAIKVNGKSVRPALPLKDCELQHILNKLIVEGYVKKEMMCPGSNRTKDRKKMDVFYRVSFLQLKDEDWLGGEALKAFRAIMSAELVEKASMVVREPLTKKILARAALRGIKITNTSDEDLDEWLNGGAVSP
jgi:hypothetical protein